ncbi:hypothetical protein OKA04_03710 [Luteolibacter flavescens]|uniref:Uncharacterized protein n=1 Tax=Luteolibacter flavescens TaxID=1859460 RepID=A0ABT3FJV6_9BACT|nr:hypothetical protein [Luteolibacter flavescens]MCW1883820.1 hypothetical protein [Luteolibacter flavescens]
MEQPKGWRLEVEKQQRKAVADSGILPAVGYFDRVDARGTEHRVRFRGRTVEKHQHSSGWIATITDTGKIGLAYALPTEYLRRLDLQNKLFGDDLHVIGKTSGSRFATSQPTLKGGEPTSAEIRDVLTAAGWERVAMDQQELPPPLMGSAWWHRGEDVVLLDARKPNFKKTDFGVLPIDLILTDLTPEMRKILC